ncbi:GNAT family N-acetyltransferase [Paenarthrobacter sp. RAF54_2]|uniref:GNAT family N-acetyltransferase n=1 Tax=Paenarthrobacter sp. RAF54_2 TaxID=3233061 RepID=UPI003F9B426F
MSTRAGGSRQRRSFYIGPYGYGIPCTVNQRKDASMTAFEFQVVNDEKTGIYEAILGDTEIAGLPYNLVDDDRLVLLATSVFPKFRKQGIATELIRRVFDDVRAQGKTVTIMCPIVRTFIERNPQYADLIDPKHPGVIRGSHGS